MLKSHQNAFPGKLCRYPRRPYIDLIPWRQNFCRHERCRFSAVDVQGFEKQVLAGGKSTIDDHCVGMHLELSPLLYEVAHAHS